MKYTQYKCLHGGNSIFFYVSPSSTVTTYESYTEYTCVHAGNSILFLCLPKL